MENDTQLELKEQPGFIQKLKSIRKILRWLLIPILLWIALQHLDSIYLELQEVDLNPSYLIFLGLFVLCIFCSQAGVTKTIVDASDSKISFFKAIQLNIAGGFWGLVMPFGSASYKAQALKLDYQISIKRYASMFLFSTLLSAWLSAIFLCATVIKLPLWPYRLVFMGVGGVSLLMIPIFYFMKYKQSHLADLPVKGLGSWHVLGLLSYIGLYCFCFKTLGWPIPLIALSAWVAVQSLLFVFPLVPGNLVIMEALGAYLLVQQNLSAESVVIGITLMRLACLLGLLCLSPWVAFGRAREKVKVS